MWSRWATADDTGEAGVEVHAIYEPRQQGTAEEILLDPDEGEEERLEKLAAMLGLVKQFGLSPNIRVTLIKNLKSRMAAHTFFLYGTAEEILLDPDEGEEERLEKLALMLGLVKQFGLTPNPRVNLLKIIKTNGSLHSSFIWHGRGDPS